MGTSVSGLSLSPEELEDLVFLRVFKQWFKELSAPARRHLKCLSPDLRIALIEVIVNQRINRDVPSVAIPPASAADHLQLVAA